MLGDGGIEQRIKGLCKERGLKELSKIPWKYMKARYRTIYMDRRGIRMLVEILEFDES